MITPPDINVEPEPEKVFNDRLSVPQEEYDALFTRIAIDIATCLDLGGGETGMVEIELNAREWQILVIHLSYSGYSPIRYVNSRSRDLLRDVLIGKSFSHIWVSSRGRARLYRRESDENKHTR